MQNEEIKDPARQIKSNVLSRRTDHLVRELSGIETEVTNRSLQLLRSRFTDEKGNWARLYEAQKNEMDALRKKLTEAETRMKSLQDECTREETVELERIKAASQELQFKKKEQEQRWGFVEEQVTLHRNMADEARQKLLEQERAFSRVKQDFAENEKKLRELLEQRGGEVVRLREDLSQKEQNWLSAKTDYEKLTARLQDQVSGFQKALQDERDSLLNINDRKDRELTKLQEALREVMIHLTEERRLTQSLKADLAGRDQQIIGLEKQRQEDAGALEAERNNSLEITRKARIDREEYEREAGDREKTLRDHFGGEITQITAMLNSVETQLKVESASRQELENSLQLMQQDKKAIEDRMAALAHRREHEIARMNDEIATLNAGLKEERQLIGLEKEANDQLKMQIAQLHEENRKKAGQLEKDKDEFAAILAGEKKIYERRINELLGRIQELYESRENETKAFEAEIMDVNGQLRELKAIYQSKRLEEEQNKSRVEELEAALGMQLELADRERAQRESTLLREREAWEKARDIYADRENKLREGYELEIAGLRSELGEMARKIVEYDKALQKHNKEMSTQDTPPETNPKPE